MPISPARHITGVHVYGSNHAWLLVKSEIMGVVFTYYENITWLRIEGHKVIEIVGLLYKSMTFVTEMRKLIATFLGQGCPGRNWWKQEHRFVEQHSQGLKAWYVHGVILPSQNWSSYSWMFANLRQFGHPCSGAKSHKTLALTAWLKIPEIQGTVHWNL